MAEKQTDVTGIDTTKIKELQALDSQKRQLEKDLDEVKLRREELEKNLLEQFAEAGIDSITVDGKKVYLKRDTWTSALEGDRAKACTFLKEHGLDFYVNETFNATSISAYVREHRNAFSPSFSSVSDNTGTKAALDAPSPTRSRSMFGNRNAMRNASSEGITAATITSRAKPSTRLIRVPPAKMAVKRES